MIRSDSLRGGPGTINLRGDVIIQRGVDGHVICCTVEGVMDNSAASYEHITITEHLAADPGRAAPNPEFKRKRRVDLASGPRIANVAKVGPIISRIIAPKEIDPEIPRGRPGGANSPPSHV